MAKFKVLRPIEHNEKLYLPEHTQAPAIINSAGNGLAISCDASGAIELTEAEAARLLDSRIESLKESLDPKKVKKS